MTPRQMVAAHWTWMLLPDGEMGGGRSKHVLSSGHSNIQSLNCNYCALTQVSNPRRIAPERTCFSSILARQSYCMCKYFLKQTGAHKHLFFLNLALTIMGKTKDCQPLAPGERGEGRLLSGGWRGQEPQVRKQETTDDLCEGLPRDDARDRRHGKEGLRAPMRLRTENGIYLTEILMDWTLRKTTYPLIRENTRGDNHLARGKLFP